MKITSCAVAKQWANHLHIKAKSALNGRKKEKSLKRKVVRGEECLRGRGRLMEKRQ